MIILDVKSNPITNAAVEVVFDLDGGIEAAGDGDFFGFSIGAFHDEEESLARLGTL